MTAVGLLSAFITMRLAIHGREVEIPNVAGLTIAEAKEIARNLGLNVNMENQFYSTVTPAGRVLSQYPAPGTKVRREWVMRVAESIGPQKVSVPNVIGKTEREATATIRRLSLDLGTVAYIPAPGQVGVVLSQTPTPAAAGVDGPRISLLVSEPVPVARARPALPETPPSETPASDTLPQPAAEKTVGADSASTPPATQTSVAPRSTAAPATPQATASQAAAKPAANEDAYVMPNLIGLTLSAATARVSAMGLHISSMESVAPVIRQIPSVGEPAAPGSPSQIGAVRPIAPIAPITLSNTVTAQRPSAGHRVTRTDAIRITLSR